MKVALICGNGASSSFMAIQLRNAIKAKKLVIEVVVCPENTLNNSIETFDFIFIGPHLDFLAKELRQTYNIRNHAIVIPYEIYATMDGSKLLDMVLSN